MIDFSHLDALSRRMVNEKIALDAATKPSEIAIRKVWVDQCKKEIASEYVFLGIDAATLKLNDDELLAELMA
jgi:hypothetical protein